MKEGEEARVHIFVTYKYLIQLFMKILIRVEIYVEFSFTFKKIFS